MLQWDSRRVDFSILSSAVGLLLLAVGKAQIRLSGHCPPIQTPYSFNMSRYAGQWYVIERYFNPYELLAECWSERYEVGKDGNLDLYVGYDIRVFNFLSLTQEIHSDLFIDRKQNPANLRYKASFFPLGGVRPFEGVYQVVDTDYENWSIEWMCDDSFVGHTETAYLLGRRLHLDSMYLHEAKRRMKEVGLDARHLRGSGRSNCRPMEPSMIIRG